MADYFNISIIGSGNLASHLAPELENAGHRIIEVYSRSVKHAKEVQKRLYNAEVQPSLDFSGSEAEIIILCIADDAIKEVAREIAIPEGAIVVHTSGGQSIDKLGYVASSDIGVFYPLQTFTRGKQISFEDIPILIEAENNHTKKILKNLGRSISKHVIPVSSVDRMAIHVAAVFACNFTNKMLEIANDILNERRFNLDLLRPLIVETMNKSLDIGPENAQTGPAVRGDLEVLNKHMAFLKGSQYRELYEMITEKIRNR